MNADDAAPELTPRERAEMFALRFRGTANSYALGYGGPVYLVGSMLTSLAPGDIDIRCLIAREDVELWFGADADRTGSPEWSPGAFAMHREMLKQSRRLTRRWKMGRFDFQFQVALFSDITGEPIQDDRPRLRLDAVPLEMLAAGRGEP